MKSLFARNFLIYALVIVLGFTILGSSFIYQVNRFSSEETQLQLNETSEQAVISTHAYFQLRGNADWNDKFNASYRVALNMLADDCRGTIFVGDAEGKLLFIANEDETLLSMKSSTTLRLVHRRENWPVIIGPQVGI